MRSDWAAEHLHIIRTLMERSAVYRRALAPIVLSLGVLGLGAAALGWALKIQSAQGFLLYWSGVGVIGLCGAFVMARQQALKDAESFWSGPTRRVTQALLPSLFSGFAASSLAIALSGNENGSVAWIVPLWMVLYGCAVHAAGFFMPRGVKLFAWGFILAGCAVAGWFGLTGAARTTGSAHSVMGLSFGGLHLAYGIYLYFTEERKNEL